MMSNVPVISLLVVVVLSLMVVRVATIALSLTGLSYQLARFQARSAFTGAGFTTTESEKVVQHPVRRQIIMLLMLLGNAGFITAISSLILSFVGAGDKATITSTAWFRLLFLATGLSALWVLAHSQWVDQRRAGSHGNWEHYVGVERQQKVQIEQDRSLAESESEPESESGKNDHVAS